VLGVVYLLITATVMQKDLELEAEFGQESSESKSDLDKDAISHRLEEIYKRLEFIDADAAEARAASILAVCFISLVCMILQYILLLLCIWSLFLSSVLTLIIVVLQTSISVQNK
jgi:hypothetical protein